MTRRRGGGSHRYPRTARLSRLFHEIVAEELERIDDERLELVTVIDVDVDQEVRFATVLVASPSGPEGDAQMLAALADHRVRLQAAIGRQARTKRTPELTFVPDPVTRSAAQIDDLLRQLPVADPDAPDADPDAPSPYRDGTDGAILLGGAPAADRLTDGPADAPEPTADEPDDEPDDESGSEVW
ncbi:MAG TPA: ribosome-binding factor A [Acidimicrobiales bacterium]|nr:ribosome-binding factor A [Acidimicrobiales bacterium]